MKRLLIAIPILLTACEKTIEPQLEKQTPKLVVDAQIEDGGPPIVVLSNSIDYFSVIDSGIISNSYVHNAKVSISNGARTVQLGEYSTSSGAGNLYFYSTDIFSIRGMIGIPGQTYKLTVETGGQTYSATTSIPVPAKTLDSIWWKKLGNRPDTASQVVLMGRVTDPPGLGNYIRYFTKVNSGQFQAGYISVFDDQVVDGKRYDIQIDRGVEKSDELNTDDYGLFKKGDTVTVKFCNIDKGTFDFWRTWEYAFRSVGNPFSSPGVVTGNISNGALGAFCGYASLYKTLIIPK